MTSQQESNSVDRFVSLVQRRLNRHWAMRILWSAMITGSVVLVLIALFYVIPGYQMPWYWYPIVAGSALVLGTVVWLFTKADAQSAAHFADQYFQMKDALRSHLNFRRSGQQDGFYQLQSEQANDGVQHRNVAAIRLRHPYKLTTLALVLLTVAVSLGFKSASPEVMERLAREEANIRNSQQVKKEMLELINELEKSLEDDVERELVDPAKLRKWVSELTQTADHREALRQYAQLERKFNQAAMKLQQRKDEQLLNQASQELKKDENLQELADKLAQKKYDKAAADLEKMKSEKFDLDKLSQEKKDLAKLKAAAKRMAQAAKDNKAKRKEMEEKDLAKVREGKQRDDAGNARNAGKAGQQNGREWEQDAREWMEGDELEELLEELDEAAEEWEEELEFIEGMDDSDQSDEDLEGLEKARGRANSKLDQLGKKLRRMARKRSALSKLKKLGQQALQLQSGGGIAKDSGGLNPGSGQSDKTRQQQDELKDNGQYSKLKGIKGQGESLTKIEEAEDGSGVSRRQATATERNFEKQFESFVEREDIPEDLKNGVRNYFIQIHQGVEASESGGER